MFLVNIIDGFKVWGADAYSGNNKSNLIIFWGQIGKPMNKLKKKKIEFKDSSSAKRSAWDKFHQKRGYYIPLDRSKYFDFVDKYDRLGLMEFIICEYKRFGFK